MALVRHDPFRELLSLQDQLFRSLQREREDNLATAWTPLVDIFEDQDGITIKAELPEVDPKDVDIQVDGNTLTLKGERKLEKAETRDNYSRIERTYGAFQRTFQMPSTVDVEHISAESKDGVYRIYLPKKPETKPRSIKVGVNVPTTKQ